jgi:hypothetical protein
MSTPITTTWTTGSYGTGNIAWSNMVNNGGYTFNTSTGSQTFKVAGDAEFEGDVKIQGVSLSSRLDKIEERLAIMRPNADLEQRWDELKALGDRYRELEKEIIEKEKIWDLLKK